MSKDQSTLSGERVDGADLRRYAELLKVIREDSGHPLSKEERARLDACVATIGPDGMMPLEAAEAAMRVGMRLVQPEQCPEFDHD